MSRAVPLLPLWAVRPVQSLSACTRVHFTFTFFYRLMLAMKPSGCVCVCVCVSCVLALYSSSNARLKRREAHYPMKNNDPYAPATFTSRKYSWYSFLLEAESTPEPYCGRKDYVNEKFQPAIFRLVAQCLNQVRYSVPPFIYIWFPY
jgi:hypothetical protein